MPSDLLGIKSLFISPLLDNPRPQAGVQHEFQIYTVGHRRLLRWLSFERQGGVSSNYAMGSRDTAKGVHEA